MKIVKENEKIKVDFEGNTFFLKSNDFPINESWFRLDGISPGALFSLNVIGYPHTVLIITSLGLVILNHRLSIHSILDTTLTAVV